MKKHFYLTLLLMALILCACTKTISSGSNNAINPGDKIGNFLVTTGTKEDKITYMTFVHCPVSDNNVETCELPVGTLVNVSNSLIAQPTGEMSLDEIWAGHTYEMTIENHPVNLEAFGSIDVYHPAAGTLRNWNVVVTTEEPGTVTVNFSIVAEGKPYKGTFVVIFKAP